MTSTAYERLVTCRNASELLESPPNGRKSLVSPEFWPGVGGSEPVDAAPWHGDHMAGSASIGRGSGGTQ